MENKIARQIYIKAKHELNILKQRESNHIQGTPKIILGKLKKKVQEIWADQYINYPLQELRDLHSNEVAFDFVSLIIKASRKLALIYGNFILNQNMVFKTVVSQELFIWINPNFLINQPKIYLPESPEGQLTMIKSLVNYFKLWLQIDFTILSQAKTLEEFEFKLLNLRNKNYSNSNTGNSTRFDSQIKKSSTSSQNFADKYSCKFKNIINYPQSLKGARSNQIQTGIKNKFQFKYLVNNYVKNPGLKRKNSDYQIQENDDILQIPQTYSAVCRTTGTPNKKYFPFKTTSANSKKILQLIRKADKNPDQYVPNNIKLSIQQLMQLQQRQKQIKIRQSLNQVEQQLDNLFIPTQQEEQYTINSIKIIQQEFKDLLE